MLEALNHVSGCLCETEHDPALAWSVPRYFGEKFTCIQIMVTVQCIRMKRIEFLSQIHFYYLEPVRRVKFSAMIESSAK